MSPTLQLACELIAARSVTPADAGCQDLIMQRLAGLGFSNESLVFEEVTNLWTRRGDSGPLVCIAGHTDVVPTGPEQRWQRPPFEPVIEDGVLYGRGASDMKGPLAAAIVAVENFVRKHPDHKGSIAFLLTSDEEGPAKNGTIKVVETLEARHEKIDYCLVCEPSATHQVGDAIKNGRRGSLNGTLRVKGIQGHVAYPHLASNPIHLAAPALAELTSEEWDQGNAFFPATSFQISNIKAGTGVTNIIPGELEVMFNFRFSSELTESIIKRRTHAILDRYELEYELDWALSGDPFLTLPGALVNACRDSIREVTGLETELSTSGGTSDGRFIAPTGAQVVELGTSNATIHKVNECASVEDLEKLTLIYEGVLERLLLA